jgi:hypothetical protein
MPPLTERRGRRNESQLAAHGVDLRADRAQRCSFLRSNVDNEITPATQSPSIQALAR